MSWGAGENQEEARATDGFTRQMERVLQARDKRDRAENEAKLLSKEYEFENEKLLKMFQAADVKSMKALGYLFYTERRESVTTPKTIEEKNLLFDFLKELDIYIETISVASPTLNSLFNRLNKEAIERGESGFKLPGCGEPKESFSLKIKRA